MTETFRCPGCELKAMERENLPENAKGIRIGLVPNIDDEDDDDEDGAP